MSTTVSPQPAPSQRPALGDRAAKFIPLGIAAVVLAVAMSTVTPWPVGAFEDDAIYTVLAKSLAEGHGYRLINLPDAPNAAHFPPGYPALLAILWRAWPSFPDNLVLFKFVNALLLALAAAGTYVFALRRLALSKTAAAVTAMAATLSVVILLLTGMVLSEPLFLALLLPTLFAAERVIDTGSTRSAIVAGLLLGVLSLVRTLGLFAIPGVIGLLVWRRRYAAALVLIVSAGILLVPWQVWVALHQHEVPSVIAGKYGSYSGWVAQGYAQGGSVFLGQVVAKNAADLFRMLSYLHAPVDSLWLRVIALAGLLAVLGIGAIRLTRRAPATIVFVVLYMGAVLIWPFEPNRFLLGIWPLGAVCVALGVAEIARWRPTQPLARSARYGAIAVCLGLAVGVATYNGRGYQHSWWVPVQRSGGEQLKPIVEWVAHNTAMDDVIATDRDPAVYLYTGRRAIPTSTWMVRERVHPLTADEDVAAVRVLLTQLQPRYYVPTSVIGLRTATTLAKASPPVLRYLGATPNGAAFALVRK